jgi:tetratricopeptide (TPR) repeat protein
MAHGYWLRAQFRFSEAREVFQHLVGMNADLAGPHFMLGICLLELGCIEAALPHYEAALRLGAADANVWMTHARIGEAHLLLGRDEEAISWFRQALAANPDNSAINRSRINIALASAHALLGRLDEARLQVAEANRIWPFHTIRRWTIRRWHRHPPLQGWAAKEDRLREGVLRAGLRDHADEDADFGIAPSHNLESNDFGHTPLTAPGAATLRTADLAGALAERKPLVIDTMCVSGLSVPGAVGLQHSGAGGSLEDRVQDRLRPKIAQLTNANLVAPIVTVGWNSEAWAGRNLALRLVALGYTNVSWYRGGNEAWEVNGHPQTELAVQDW